MLLKCLVVVHPALLHLRLISCDVRASLARVFPS